MSIEYFLCDADLGEEEALAVAAVVRGKWLSVGPKTAAFEEAFAYSLGARHAVAVSSGAAALHLALLALGVGPGDEVLVPSYAFVAAANAVLQQGATPVWVDIAGPEDLNLDPDDLEAKVTPRSRAVLAVHVAGFPPDLGRLMPAAARHGLAVVEDASDALGAPPAADGGEPAPRKAGTTGHAGCFSFCPDKNLVTGEGGMLVTDDADLARRARAARSHGISRPRGDEPGGRRYGYDVPAPGWNYRCTELTSALGLVQLGKVARSAAQRQRLAARYRRRLAGDPRLTLPFAGRADGAYQFFPVLVGDAALREPVREALLHRGVQSSVHYPPAHLFTHFRGRFPGAESLPRTEDAAARELTLPLHPLLREADVDVICDLLAESLAEAAADPADRRTR